MFSDKLLIIVTLYAQNQSLKILYEVTGLKYQYMETSLFCLVPRILLCHIVYSSCFFFSTTNIN